MAQEIQNIYHYSRPLPQYAKTTIVSSLLVQIILFNYWIFQQIMKGKPTAPKQTQPQVVIKPVEKQWIAEDYVSHNISLEEVQSIKTAFDIFDADGSGFVDPMELKHAFESLGFGVGNKLVHQKLAALNETNIGAGLSFPQFLKMATHKLSDYNSRAEIDKVFQSYDVKRVGKFTVTDLKNIAHHLGESLTDEEIENIFVKADKDEDGFVTAEDFYNLMTPKSLWQQ